MQKVAFITGASRGIGRAVALKLAENGWGVAIASKSVEAQPNLPGTIYSVAEEVNQRGGKALPIQCNVREVEQVHDAARATLDTFGRIDVVINNAGALWWADMLKTPMKRFDLVMDVNLRGAYAVTQAFLPAMLHQGHGHVITMSPPVNLDKVGATIGYMISKFGMTMLVHGLAQEFKGQGIHATALWPRTLVESYATINYQMADRSQWRKADILADATWEILQRPEETNGKALIDEEFLRSIGVTDFEQYNCVPGGKPLEMSYEDMKDIAMATKK